MNVICLHHGSHLEEDDPEKYAFAQPFPLPQRLRHKQLAVAECILGVQQSPQGKDGETEDESG